MKDVIEYLGRHGIEYTIDRNPSPEKIERIKRYFKRKEELEKFIKERYK